MATPASEELTGKNRVIKNVFYSWLGYLLFFVAGFLLPRFIDDHLGQFSLGIWDFAWSIVNYLSYTALGMGSSLNRFVAKYRAENDIAALRTAVSTVVVIQVALAVVIVVAVSAIALSLPYFFRERFGEEMETVRWVCFFLGLSLSAQFLFDTSRGILTGCHRWDLFNTLNSVTYLAAVLLMVVALFSGYGLIALSVIYLVQTIVQGVIRTVMVRRICPEAVFDHTAVSYAFFKKILVFGGKTIFIYLSPLIVMQTGYILVASVLGPAVLAVFARPYSLVKHIETFISRFTFILTPMASSLQSNRNRAELQRFTLNCTRFGCAITLPAFTLFYFYAAEVIEIWMGRDYVNQDLITILAVGSLFSVAQSPLVRVLIGLNYHGDVAKVSFLSLPLVFIPGLFVVQALGWSVEAISIVMVATMGLSNGVIVPIYCCRKLDIPLNRYLREVFFAPVAITLLAAGVLVLMQAVVKRGTLFDVVEVGVFSALIAVGYWAFLLTRGERAIVKNLLPGLQGGALPK